MSKIENAVSMFGEGFVCSQALLATYGTQFRLDREIALKAAAAFVSSPVVWSTNEKLLSKSL